MRRRSGSGASRAKNQVDGGICNEFLPAAQIAQLLGTLAVALDDDRPRLQIAAAGGVQGGRKDFVQQTVLDRLFGKAAA